MNKNKYLSPYGLFTRVNGFNKKHYELNKQPFKLEVNSINKTKIRFNEDPYLNSKTNSSFEGFISKDILKKLLDD
jgi:hypothetical protein